jgi:xanthine dehydrogenase accessory factor
MNLYEIIDRYLEEGKKGAVATIVNKIGAAPREKGARMVVMEDGSLFGTIGGGQVEADACKEALAVMAGNQAKLLHVRMNSARIEDQGMVCGGDVDILIEPLLLAYRDVYRAVSACEKKGRKGLIVTRRGSAGVSKAFVDAYGTILGDAVDAREGEKLLAYMDEKAPLMTGELILEPTKTVANLFIFGAGHVSLFVSQIAKLVDFNVTVIDDRPEFANETRFPEADQIIVDDFARVFGNLGFSGDVYIVIVTRGHKHDALVLDESLKMETKYIGMIGSKRKVRIVLEHLKAKGFSEAVLKRVYSPIGIDIHSETPQEIGVSIVAELIKVRGEE